MVAAVARSGKSSAGTTGGASGGSSSCSSAARAQEPGLAHAEATAISACGGALASVGGVRWRSRVRLPRLGVERGLSRVREAGAGGPVFFSMDWARGLPVQKANQKRTRIGFKLCLALQSRILLNV